jgi:hypothetical protein
VAYNARLTQLTLNIQAHRDCLAPRRLQRLRTRRRAEQELRVPSTRAFVQRRPQASHHVKRVASRSLRDRVFHPSPTRAKRPFAQGQHNSRSYAHIDNHALPRHYDRARRFMLLSGLQRHPHPSSLHSPSNKYLCRQPHPVESWTHRNQAP